MKHLGQFIEHTVTGAIQLLVITLVAVGLHFVVQLGELTTSNFIIYSLKAGEHLLFAFDMTFFVMHLSRSFKILINQLWKN